MRFTIVTPSYNQAAYLPETIEGVLSQEGSFAIEYFVMDGGSTDGSAAIIKRYADRLASGDWRIGCAGIEMHWTSAPDNGQSDAINKGLQKASGDVCAYLNSDDTYSAGTLARVAAAFERHPASDFIYGDGEVIDEASQVQWVWLARPYEQSLLTSYHFAWNAFPNYIMQQATFWRRRVMEKIGYFDESLHYAMDLEYWVRAGNAGLHLTHVPENLARFRMIAGTKSLSSPMAFWDDQMEIYRRYQPFRRLPKFLSFYYYNAALHMGRLPEAADAGIFERWAELPDRQRLERVAALGLARAALILALHLERRGESGRAAEAYGFAVSRRPILALHYLGILYKLRLCAPCLERALHWCYRKAVECYRQRRIHYRYVAKAKE